MPADPFFGLNDPFSNHWPGFISPGDSFAEMQQRMDELMNSMTQGFPFFNQEDFGFGFISNGPAISMTEDAEEYRVVISVPDGQEVEVNTELTGNALIVSASVKSERDENVSGFTSRSMQESRFSQSLYLAEPVDESGLNVERADNEIVISIPKANGTI
jgi:HSP20 family molecular chaperone IbpA